MRSDARDRAGPTDGIYHAWMEVLSAACDCPAVLDRIDPRGRSDGNALGAEDVCSHPQPESMRVFYSGTEFLQSELRRVRVTARGTHAARDHYFDKVDAVLGEQPDSMAKALSAIDTPSHPIGVTGGCGEWIAASQYSRAHPQASVASITEPHVHEPWTTAIADRRHTAQECALRS